MVELRQATHEEWVANQLGTRPPAGVWLRGRKGGRMMICPACGDFGNVPDSIGAQGRITHPCGFDDDVRLLD